MSKNSEQAVSQRGKPEQLSSLKCSKSLSSGRCKLKKKTMRHHFMPSEEHTFECWILHYIGKNTKR